MVALSVSISASRSPSLSFSPTFFSQRCTVPIVMVGDSAGNVICNTQETWAKDVREAQETSNKMMFRCLSQDFYNFLGLLVLLFQFVQTQFWHVFMKKNNISFIDLVNSNSLLSLYCFEMRACQKKKNNQCSLQPPNCYVIKLVKQIRAATIYWLIDQKKIINHYWNNWSRLVSSTIIKQVSAWVSKISDYFWG